MEQCNICQKLCKTYSGKLKHEEWCKVKVEFLSLYNLDKSKIEKELFNLGSILRFISKYPMWKKSRYYQLFKDLNIKWSVKHAKNHPEVKKRTENTNLNKYGEKHNFSKNHPSRKKWEERLLKEEGITNVFQRESVKNKSIDTILKKYGKELWLQAVTTRGSGIISKLNKMVFSILEENDINFSIEFKIKRKDGYYYSYDILLENNKIIEINGDYWHGNPKIYKKDDIILKNSSKEYKVEDKWKYDKAKITFIKEKGYEVLIVWEKELKENFDKVKEKILKYARS